MPASPLPDPPDARYPEEVRDDTFFERAMRIATPPTDDDRCVIAGMDRPATPEELMELIEQEQARIRRERGLPPL